ncbi:hypothetical protein [Salinilacihabitans rarus]|uniref:hypothetical protein n=1 Tax=Salinilacihabitans rarus TaxID=2961596 RepID=UPI003CCE0D7F
MEPADSPAATAADLDANALARFRGDVLRPGDDGHDEARAIWNGMIDHRPAVILRATGTADVFADLGRPRRPSRTSAARAASSPYRSRPHVT